ncbi:hypothetical protein KFL_000420030 [Klebsormidium nitens]|uniref:CS domain-containing protein n=1 Tax=Klebsormidium nitens TaxID=105231 RepID=A0A1Y1HSG4_KLENI|nr:hypothetical protein KFL_000420030 [Klebsormidium nitens]|eukprot:GAQ79931.1 hypothetical protein KFL_000420030 [Klebsormidium nitens]
MPITPAYTWKETEDEVTVEVALRNTTRSQVAIASTECFLKVNSSPYLLQIDLYGEADAKRSTAEVNQSGVVFTLHKAANGLWGRLTAVGEKQELLERRQKSLESSREAAGKQKEDARLLKERTNKLALEKQWALEEAKRQTLEKRKAEELKSAQEDLLQWQTNTTKTGSESENTLNGQRLSGQDRDGVRSDGRMEPVLDDMDADALSDGEDRYIPANKGRAAIEELSESDEEEVRGLVNRASEERKSKLPPIEASEKLAIPILLNKAANQDFSKDGPIPTVVKQAANPGFGNLLSESEEANDESPLVARSSRRLQPPTSGKEAPIQEPDIQEGGSEGDKENQQQLETSKPAASDRDRSQKRGKVAEAVPAAALPPPRRRMVVPVQFTAKELRPNVPARESRLQEIELKKAQAAAADDDAMDISERQPAFLKDKGDALYRAGDFQGAVSAYSRALEKDPSASLCFSNRGACQLRLGRVDECVSDCTRAVDLLRQQLEECEDETDGQDGAAGESDGRDKMNGKMDGQDQAGRKSDGPEAPGSTGSEETTERTNALGKLDGKESDGSDSQGSEVVLTEQNEERDQEDGLVTRAVNEDGASTNSPGPNPSKETAYPSSRIEEKGSLVSTELPPVSEQADSEGNGQNGDGKPAGRPKRPSEKKRLRTALVKALVRRAAARCEKALLAEAISDYESALRLDPGNRGIERDLEALRDCVNPPTQSEWKARGDVRYREGEIEGAAEAYTRAVDCEGQDAAVTRACVSNRSACYLQLERFAEAEADCSRALALLGYSPVADVTPPTDVPTANVADSQACLKLLSRRGMVFGHQKKYDDAMRDLAAAAGIAAQIGRLETVEDLNRDIELLRELQARQLDVK